MIPLIALEVLGQAWLVLFGVVIILGLALLFGRDGLGMSPVPPKRRKAKEHEPNIPGISEVTSLKYQIALLRMGKDLARKDAARAEDELADIKAQHKARIVVASIALRQVREYLQSIGSLSQEQASLLSSVKQSLNFINEDRPDMAAVKKAITAENVAREFRQAYGSAKESFTPVNWIEEANRIDPSTQQKLYYGIDLSEGEAAKVERLYSGSWEYNDAPHDLTGSDPIFKKDTEEAGKAAGLNFEPVVESEITGMFLDKGLGKSPTKRWKSPGHFQNLPKSDSVKWWLELDEDVQASLGDKYNLTPECIISFETLDRMHKDWLCGQSPLKCTDPDCSVCYADRNASSPEPEDKKAKERPSWETPDGTQYGIDLATDPEEKTKVTRKKRIKYYDEALKWWIGLDESTRIALRTEYDIPAMLTPSELDLVDIWHDES